MKKIFTVAFVLMLAAGCAGSPESSAVSASSVKPEETAKADSSVTPAPETKPEETPAETQKPAGEPAAAEGLRTGVWASYEGGSLSRYFIFDNDMHGRDFDSYRGKSMDFRYEVDGDTIIFYMGEDENVVSAIFGKTDDTHLTVTWDYGSEEEMVWVKEYEEDIRIYSTEELCDLAMDYYVRSTGSEPADYAAEDDEDNQVAVQLYDNVDGHNSTAAYYLIDRFTALGKDVNSGETIRFDE